MIGVRGSLTGYLIPARLGDGAWMGWESSSAAIAVVIVAAVAVAYID